MKNTTFILKYNSKFDFQILLILTVYDCLKNGFFFQTKFIFRNNSVLFFCKTGLFYELDNYQIRFQFEIFIYVDF